MLDFTFALRFSSSVGKMIKACTNGFNNELELKELLAFHDEKLSQLGTAKRDTEIAIENAKANLQWMKKHSKETTNWFKEARARQNVDQERKPKM